MRRRALRFTIAGMALLTLLTLAIPPALASSNRTVDVIVAVEDFANPNTVASEHRVETTFIYRHALNGFAGSVPEGRLNGLRNDRRVDYVEFDQEVHLQEQQIPTGIPRSYAGPVDGTGPNNDSIDIDGSDDHRVDVDVAVLDTGIDFEHPDLNVVKSTSVDCSGGSPFKSSCTVGAGDDDHYHGTHVAGTIGAIDNEDGVVGVAPGARLWSVKVLNSNGSGYLSWIIAGIDYVKLHADKIEVANMSLGGGFSQAENDAITNSIIAGVVYAVAAGNSDADAAGYSPASTPDAITVSALADFDGKAGGVGAKTCRTDQDDTLADFSNWGSVVDITAPGVCILSTYPIEQGSYGTISGTSMASPHVAGAAALLASQSKPTDRADVLRVRDSLVSTGNYVWDNSDDGDSIKEPLLDVSDSTVFSPVFAASGGSTIDNPTVDLTSPAPDATLTGAVTLTATATDGSAVEKVEFFAGTMKLGDGTLSSGSSTDGTWSLNWDSALLTDGTYTFSARASDGTQQVEEASTNVKVSNTTTDISLTVTAYKQKGERYADLRWTEGVTVDVYKDGSNTAIATNQATQPYTDGPLGKGGGSASYRVCKSGTTTCTDWVVATW